MIYPIIDKVSHFSLWLSAAPFVIDIFVYVYNIIIFQLNIINYLANQLAIYKCLINEILSLASWCNKILTDN